MKDTNKERVEGFDICYSCSTVQDYQTMKDIDDTFAIYCDDCHTSANEPLK